ncbi:MAG TPA: protein translocase subunit SecF [Actinomycetaceae bacterium]|nr:protein translocase subunit SecF [Actinomycetaceae bacterium]
MFSFSRWGNELYTADRSYNIVGRRRIWFTIAIVGALLSFLVLGVKGMNLGIEFRGGTEFTISGVSTTSSDPATSVLQDAGVSDVRAAVIGGSSLRIQTEALDAERTEQLRVDLAAAYGADPSAITSTFVGPAWGADVTAKAVQGLIIFLVLVTLMMSVYFRSWRMSVAAVVALLHDLVLTVGLYALIGFEVTPASMIGFLTILGYSLYDTVVVFDKVRENGARVLDQHDHTYEEAANLAVNQTLVRSINTSVVGVLPVASILFVGAFMLGAGTLKDIALALFIGMIVSTLSSIFLATPLLVFLRNREPEIAGHTADMMKRRAGEGPKSLEVRLSRKDRLRLGASSSEEIPTEDEGVEAATAPAGRVASRAVVPGGHQGRAAQPKRKSRSHR